MTTHAVHVLMAHVQHVGCGWSCCTRIFHLFVVSAAFHAVVKEAYKTMVLKGLIRDEEIAPRRRGSSTQSPDTNVRLLGLTPLFNSNPPLRFNLCKNKANHAFCIVHVLSVCYLCVVCSILTNILFFLSSP
jgi:hypothetical protein